MPTSARVPWLDVSVTPSEAPGGFDVHARCVQCGAEVVTPAAAFEVGLAAAFEVGRVLGREITVLFQHRDACAVPYRLAMARAAYRN